MHGGHFDVMQGGKVRQLREVVEEMIKLTDFQQIWVYRVSTQTLTHNWNSFAARVDSLASKADPVNDDLSRFLSNFTIFLFR